MTAKINLKQYYLFKFMSNRLKYINFSARKPPFDLVCRHGRARVTLMYVVPELAMKHEISPYTPFNVPDPCYRKPASYLHPRTVGGAH